jgi:flagellar M-ring protein FliF
MVSSLPNLNDVDEDEQPRKARVPAWMNNAKAMGETQLQTLKTVGTNWSTKTPSRPR